MAARGPGVQTQGLRRDLPPISPGSIPAEACGTDLVYLQSLGLAAPRELLDGQALIFDQTPAIIRPAHSGNFSIRAQIVGDFPTLQFLRWDPDAASIVNIVIPDFGDSRVAGGDGGFDLEGAAKKFYEFFPDSYDMIAFIPQSGAPYTTAWTGGRGGLRLILEALPAAGRPRWCLIEGGEPPTEHRDPSLVVVYIDPVRPAAER